MTSINLAPRSFAPKCPADAHDPLLDAPDAERAAAALACGVLLSSMVAVGWAAGVQAQTRTSSASKTAPRTAVAGSTRLSYEVLGKRYNIRPSSDGYRERGTASWYGRPFDGRPTSSGEMYDMNELTAAHPTLPIPTWVEVTNLKNDKRVVVKINDRGPFVGKRLIDLSYGAAKKLDMVRDGTASVEVRALPGPPAEKTPAPRNPPSQGSTQARERRDAPERPASTAAAPKPRPETPPRSPVRQSPPVDPQRLFAEAGRFTKREDAVELVDDLKAEGFMNAFVVTEDTRRRSVHHVRVGPLADAAAVDRMNERLRALGARRSHSVAMR